MNIAYFLTPKQNVAYLYDDFTIRQGLEKLRHHGFTALPVITKDNEYAGTVSEGDFLWYLVDDPDERLHKTPMRDVESSTVRDILPAGKNPPVRITATVEELLVKVLNQNFIPVVDDRGMFIGIVTRSAILRHFTADTLPDGMPAVAMV